MTGLVKSTFCILLVGMAVFGQTNRSIEMMTNGQVSGSMPSVWHGTVAYVEASVLAQQLGMRFYENTQKKKVVLTLGQHAVTMTHRNPFILVDKRAMQMPSPPIAVEGKMYVPLTYFIYAAQNLFTQQLSFEPDSARLLMLPGAYNITGVNIENLKNGCLIHIKTARSFKPEDISFSINNQWLNLTIYGGTLDSSRIVSKIPAGMIKSVIPAVFPQSVQLSFLCDQKIAYKDFELNSGEITLMLRSGKSDESVYNDSAADRRRWLIDTIILDPGHGGRDPGAIGVTGTKEKEINLRIALMLKEYMDKALPDVKVLMTRDSDKFVGLNERTQFAIANQGKLFISIHCDANRKSTVRGFSTWFLGRARSKQALEVAQKENSVIELEDNPKLYEEFEGISFILNAIAQNVYMKESENLAQMVNKAMKSRTEIPDAGVHQAGLYVLINSAMPTVLVETAFLSNKYEDRLLKTRTFQRSIAEAIGESLVKFKATYEKGI